MPGVNMHGFKKISRAYKELKTEYKDLMDFIYEDEDYTEMAFDRVDRDRLWDSLYILNDLYVNSSKLLITIDSTFSILSNLGEKAKYEKIQREVTAMQASVISEYESYKDLIITAGAGFIESELIVIKDFMIEGAINR